MASQSSTISVVPTSASTAASITNHASTIASSLSAALLDAVSTSVPGVISNNGSTSYLLDNITTTMAPGNASTESPAVPIKPGSGSNKFWPAIAAIFVLVAVLLSFYEVFQHLNHFNKPYLQKYIVRILWMVPIYAINSWVAMTYPSVAIYFDTARECYEAFVIYSFMKYLLNFLFYEMDLETVIDCKPRVKHLFPFHFMPPCVGGRRFVHRCKHGVLQYTVIRPVTTFIALLSQMTGTYGEGHFSFGNAWTYLLIINNISQMVAMYSLVIFYTAYRYELSPMKPLAKFLSIKAVVFFSFFQGVLITILVEAGAITRSLVPYISEEDEPAEAIARNLQDFLICVEMLIAAIVHLYAFSHQPFVDLAAFSDPCCYSFLRICDFSDTTNDVSDHFRQIESRVRVLVRSSPFGRKEASSSLVSSYSHYEDDDEALIPLRPTRYDRNASNVPTTQQPRSYQGTDNIAPSNFRN